MEPWAAGGRFGVCTGGGRDARTVTVKRCSALKPPESAAVTMIVAAPWATGVIVTRLPAVLTVATDSSEEAAW